MCDNPCEQRRGPIDMKVHDPRACWTATSGAYLSETKWSFKVCRGAILAAIFLLNIIYGRVYSSRFRPGCRLRRFYQPGFVQQSVKQSTSRAKTKGIYCDNEKRAMTFKMLGASGMKIAKEGEYVIAIKTKCKCGLRIIMSVTTAKRSVGKDAMSSLSRSHWLQVRSSLL